MEPKRKGFKAFNKLKGFKQESFSNILPEIDKAIDISLREQEKEFKNNLREHMKKPLDDKWKNALNQAMKFKIREIFANPDLYLDCGCEKECNCFEEFKQRFLGDEKD